MLLPWFLTCKSFPSICCAVRKVDWKSDFNRTGEGWVQLCPMQQWVSVVYLSSCTGSVKSKLYYKTSNGLCFRKTWFKTPGSTLETCPRPVISARIFCLTELQSVPKVHMLRWDTLLLLSKSWPQSASNVNRRKTKSLDWVTFAGKLDFCLPLEYVRYPCSVGILRCYQLKQMVEEWQLKKQPLLPSETSNHRKKPAVELLISWEIERSHPADARWKQESNLYTSWWLHHLIKSCIRKMR